MILTCFLIFMFTLPSTPGQLIFGQERRTGFCSGSIKMVSPSREVAVFRDVEGNINMKASIVSVEGCGCYRLFEKKNYRGRSYHADRMGEHRIHLRKVKSLLKVPCSMWIRRPRTLGNQFPYTLQIVPHISFPPLPFLLYFR